MVIHHLQTIIALFLILFHRHYSVKPLFFLFFFTFIIDVSRATFLRVLISVYVFSCLRARATVIKDRPFTQERAVAEVQRFLLRLFMTIRPRMSDRKKMMAEESFSQRKLPSLCLKEFQD